MNVDLFSLQYVLPRAVTSSSMPSAAPRVANDLIYCTASVCVCMYIYIYIDTNKVRVKVTLEQAVKDQTGSSYSSTLSLTSVLDGVGVQRHAPAALPPGKTRYPL